MTEMLLDQVRAVCIRHSLLQSGLLVVAVSGGADSLTLLHVLMQLRGEFDLTLHLATFDHGLRGSAGADDVRFVVETAAAWGVPATAGAADVPAIAREWSMGIEEAARKARYTFLAKVASEVGARQIALGHNRDDQGETVLMHVIRGAGLAGLRGMLPKTPVDIDGWQFDLIRPLLDTPRADIDAYMTTLNIQPRVDLTNADTTYTRNRLRHEIMPLLLKLNPQVSATLARTADLSRDDYEALQHNLPGLTTNQLGLSISRADFLHLPISQQRLLIRVAGQRLAPGLEMSFEQVAAAIVLVDKRVHGGRASLGDDVWLRVANSKLTFYREALYPADCPRLTAGSSIQIAGPGVYPLPESDWRLEVEHLPDYPIPSGHPLSALLAIEDSAHIEIRTRRAGDRFRPEGSGGHSQKLSDTLINMKVPAHWRDCVPLLLIGGVIAWFVAPTPDVVRARLKTQLPGMRNEGVLWQFTYCRR